MGERRHLRPRPVLHPSLAIAGLAVMRLEADAITEHGHDVLELAWIERGALLHTIDGRRMPGGTGSLLVIPQGAVHRYDIAVGPVLLWNLIIDPERVVVPPLPRPLDRHLASLLPVPGAPALLVEDVDLSGPCRGLMAEQSVRAVGWPQAMSAHLRLLLLASARAAEAGRARSLPRGRPRIESLRRRLEDESGRTWNLAAMAREAGLGVPGLVRAFRRHTGTTPMAYLRRVRVQRAGGMLADGATLEGAARAAGYSSASALARARRRVVTR